MYCAYLIYSKHPYNIFAVYLTCAFSIYFYNIYQNIEIEPYDLLHKMRQRVMRRKRRHDSQLRVIKGYKK